jgi:YggT family protein
MMGSGYLANPFEFLINTVFGLYILAVMMRFLLATVRADFYHPLSQFLVKITNPLLVPLRRIIPSAGKIDTASLVLMLALQMFALTLILSFRGGGNLSFLTLIVGSLAELLSLLLNVFIVVIIVQAILSWISPGSYNPINSLLYSLTAPVLRPIQKVIPPIAGIDLSPLVALVVLQLVKMLLIPPLLHVIS